MFQYIWFKLLFISKIDMTQIYYNSKIDLSQVINLQIFLFTYLKDSTHYLYYRNTSNHMVWYAQNSTLPCNPNIEQSKTLAREYESAQRRGMISEDKLKIKIKSLFSNNLYSIIQAYSLIVKGPESKIYKFQNQKKKSIHTQQKNNLQSLYTYFEQNFNHLNELQANLKRNFEKEMEIIFQKIKASIVHTFDMHSKLIRDQIEGIKSYVRESSTLIESEMKKLSIQQKEMLPEFDNNKLSQRYISKLLNLPLEQIKGYSTIFRMIDKKSPLVRKMTNLDDNFDENNESFCERQISAINISCDSIKCGQMWNVVQLLKRNDFINASFTSSQSNSKYHFENSLSIDRQTNYEKEPNPQDLFYHEDMVGKYQSLMRSAERKILNKMSALFKGQPIVWKNSKHKQQSQNQQTNQKQEDQMEQRQPLSWILNERKLYGIQTISNERIQFQFQKINQKNKFSEYQTNFKNKNTNSYYQLLDSSSQASESSQENQRYSNHKNNSFSKPQSSSNQSFFSYQPKQKQFSRDHSSKKQDFHYLSYQENSQSKNHHQNSGYSQRQQYSKEQYSRKQGLDSSYFREDSFSRQEQFSTRQDSIRRQQKFLRQQSFNEQLRRQQKFRRQQEQAEQLRRQEELKRQQELRKQQYERQEAIKRQEQYQRQEQQRKREQYFRQEALRKRRQLQIEEAQRRQQLLRQQEQRREYLSRKEQQQIEQYMRGKKLVKQHFQQDSQEKSSKQEDQPQPEYEEESKIHQVSDSQEEPDRTQSQPDYDEIRKQHYENDKKFGKSQLKYQNSNLSNQIQRDQSIDEQYSEYIKRMKMKNSGQTSQILQQDQGQINKKDQVFEKIKTSSERILEKNQKKIQQQEQQRLQNLTNSDQIYKKHSNDVLKNSRSGQGAGQNQIQQQFSFSKHQKQNESQSEDSRNTSKFFSESNLMKDPQTRQIIEGWKKGREKQSYSFLKTVQKPQENINYVQYDYQPQYQRQKPFYQTQKIQQNYFKNQQNHQNYLPEDISQFLNEDIQQQAKILSQFQRRKQVLYHPQQQDGLFKKLGTVVNEFIVPGINAYNNEKKFQNDLKKVQKFQEDEEAILQIAMDESRLQYQKIQNLRKNTHQISIIEKESVPNKFPVDFRSDSSPYFEDEQDFTNFEKFFQELSSMKASFSLQENKTLNFLDDEEQQSRPTSRKKIGNEMKIQDIIQKESQLDIEKQEFSIFVKVLKPVLLTFRNLDKYQNRPMAKYIVGDQTGIAVLYMNYYYEVKAGCCLRLSRCRVCKYRGSYEITNNSRVTLRNVQPGSLISLIREQKKLSLIRRDRQNQLVYEVKPDFNDILRECVRDFLKNEKNEQLINKPIILTVCEVNNQTKRCLFGDYSGKILAQMTQCRTDLNKNQTVLIRNIRICNRNGRIILVGQRKTIILKADQNWKFQHDPAYIPQELLGSG